MSDSTIVDTDVLRDQVREKYRAVALEPDAKYHFHTGRSSAPAMSKRCPSTPPEPTS
jgi:hypothetical protein